MLGQQVGQYRIVDKLGGGGMGVVYLAEHIELGHRVAIKLLLPQFTESAESVQRFFNEAKAATRIRHPGIVQIYDFGRHEGSVYFIMEYLEGESLGERLEKIEILAEPLAAAVVRQVAGALAVAHTAGIVHRDLKPDNIVLVPDPEVGIGERAKVLDFGIAKLADAQKGVSLKTRTGSIMGTPYYMSPEQCRGHGEIDARTDVYALGCILFELVCGQPPFLGEGLGEVLGMHQFVPAPSPRTIKPEVSTELEEVILKSLAKKPEDRFPSMEAFAAALAPIAKASAVWPVPVMVAPTASGPAQALKSTTMSQSASEIVTIGPGPKIRAKRRRRAILLGSLGAGVAAAVVAFGIVVVAGGRDAEHAAAKAAVPVQPSPPAPVAKPPVDDSRPEVLVRAVERDLGRKEWRHVLELYGDLPADSPLRGRLASAYEAARAGYLAAETPAIEKLVAEHRCDDARALAAEAQGLLPGEAGVAALTGTADGCAAVVDAGAADAAVADAGAAPAPAPSRPPARGSSRPAVARPPALRATLGPADIARAMGTVRARVVRCGANYLASSTIRVRATISPKGQVLLATADAAPAVATCVVSWVRSVRFPPSQRGATITHVFQLR